MKSFNEEFTRKLKQKTEELEKVSTIEFVPVVISRSDSYITFRTIVALLASIYVLLVTSAQSLRPWLEESLFAVAAFLVVFALVSWEPILRRVLPKRLKNAAVVDEADAAFLHEEVFATRARTGVLVFISVFERSVFVIGDKGFSKVVDPNYWSDLGLRLADDFSVGSPGQSFFEVLDDMARNIAPKFPLTGDNPNELHDDLRRR